MSHPAKNTCFVLMPFQKELNDQWELVFVPAIEACGLNPSRGDDKGLGSNIIMKDVTRCIHESSIIVADLTGRNPNVMYELGLAHAAKKPAIILARNRQDVPFDLAHIRYLEYAADDLSKLKRQLTERIQSTLAMKSTDPPDLFPELKLFDQDDFRELEYLRERASRIEINVSPETADIFFNDRLIGESPQTIRLNKRTDRNTISASAVGFFEHHADITDQNIEKGTIVITLPPRSNDVIVINKRVPSWLRYRRRDPNNPVLMMAIAKYLHDLGEPKDSMEEVQELLKFAPTWYATHIVAALIKWDVEPEGALEHLNMVVRLRPDHYIGYHNLACFYAVKRHDLARSISYLQKILDDEMRIRQYIASGEDIEADPDLSNVKADVTYGPQLLKMSGFLRQKASSNTIGVAVQPIA